MLIRSLMTDDPDLLGSSTVNAQVHRGYVAAGPRLDRGENSGENSGKNGGKTASRQRRDRGETRVNAQVYSPQLETIFMR